jgi:ketosteroid isomerase-like protein
MAGTGAQDEIRAVFDQLLKAQNAGDAERVRAMLSERSDAVHIGTDAEEWWTSKQVADGVAAAAAGDDIQAVADDIDVHVQGDVAWAEGHGRFKNASGDERPIRVTSVLVREGGQWKVVQSHASIGVPNADIFG